MFVKTFWLASTKLANILKT